MSCSQESRRQLIAGLRAIANFYETRPGAFYDGMTVTISMYAGGRRAHKAFAAMAAAFDEEGGEDEVERARGLRDSRQREKTTGSETPIDCAGAAALANPGKCEKTCGPAHIVLARNFSDKVRLEIFAPCAGRQLHPGCGVRSKRRLDLVCDGSKLEVSARFLDGGFDS